MAQYDVRRNAGRNQELIPYVLEVQSDLLEDFAARVVVPLVSRPAMPPARYLNPVFVVEGAEVVMSTLEIASLARAELSGEVVTNLAAHHDRIIRALDFLPSGV